MVTNSNKARIMAMYAFKNEKCKLENRHSSNYLNISLKSLFDEWYVYLNSL